METETAKDKEDRSFLRERFLRTVTGIIGKRATFNLFENTQVTGEFRGSDVECKELFVRGLMTPTGVIPEAILRSCDIYDIEIDDVPVYNNVDK